MQILLIAPVVIDAISVKVVDAAVKENDKLRLAFKIRIEKAQAFNF
jgi:hypothetical protein